MRRSLFSILILLIASLNPSPVQAQVDAETLLGWDGSGQPQPQSGYVDRRDGKSNVPPEKPPVPEDFKDRAGKVQLTGRAGPRMPAVPPGEVQIETMMDPLDAPQPKAATSDDFTAAPPPVQITESVPPPETRQINVIAPTATPPKPNATPPMSSVQISFDIPHLSFVFENATTTDLNAGQQALLIDAVRNLIMSQYQGQIRVLAYADRDNFSEPQVRDRIIVRTGKVRDLLIRAGAKPQQLDMRTIPKNGRDNRVDLFLTGQG
jgi:hypothetical protein